MSDVSRPLTGGCFCGACRYELNAAPLAVWACHCTDCQRQSGSAFNLTMPAPRDAFSLTQGEPAAFERTTARGRKTVIRFCGRCGTRLFSESNPQVVTIRPGTLDDTGWVKPTAQYFLASGHAWARIEGVDDHDDQPESAIFDAVRAFQASGLRFVAREG